MMAASAMTRPELMAAQAAVTAIRNQLDSEQAGLHARLEAIVEERKRAEAILEHIDEQLAGKKAAQGGRRPASGGRKRA
jgi:hypothetical protein